MRHNGLPNAIDLSRGTTLTEMLVAVVILTTGMVTVAGMLNDSISSLTHSVQHQRAVQLSSDMAEVLSGLHTNAASPTVIPVNHNCPIVTCAPTELLEHTLYNWQQQIARRLPGGHGDFRFVTDHAQPIIEIQIEWRMRGGNPAIFVTQIPVTAMAEAL
jgi:Tfp pilus assembly protein PilV